MAIELPDLLQKIRVNASSVAASEQIIARWSKTFDEAFARVRRGTRDLQDSLDDTSGAVDDLTDTFGGAGGSTDDLADSIDRLGGAADDAGAAARRTRNSYDDLAGTLRGLGDAYKDTSDAAATLAAVSDSATFSARRSREANDELADSLRDLTNAYDQAADAAARLRDEQGKGPGRPPGGPDDPPDDPGGGGGGGGGNGDTETNRIGNLIGALGALGKLSTSAAGNLGSLTSAFSGVRDVLISTTPVMALFITSIPVIASVGAGAIAFLSQLGTALFGVGINLIDVAGQFGTAAGAAGALLPTLVAFKSVSGVFAGITGPATAAADAILKFGADSDEAQAALEGLGPAAQDFAVTLADVRGAYQALKAEAGEEVLPGITAGFSRLADSILPALYDGFVGVGGVIGGTINSFADLAESGPFQTELGAVVSQNTSLVAALGNALVPLAGALVAVTAAAGPMAQRFADAAVQGSNFLLSITSGAENQAKLISFFERAGDTAISLFNGVKDLVVAFDNFVNIVNDTSNTDFVTSFTEGAAAVRDFTSSFLGRAEIIDFLETARERASQLYETVTGFGDGIADVFRIAAEAIGINFVGGLADAATRFSEFTSSVSGENQIRTFFEESGPILEEFGGLISDIIGKFGELAQGASADTALQTIQGLRTELGPVLAELADRAATLGPEIIALATAGAELASAIPVDVIIEAAAGLADLLTAILSIDGASTVIGTLVAVGVGLTALASIGGTVITTLGVLNTIATATGLKTLGAAALGAAQSMGALALAQLRAAASATASAAAFVAQQVATVAVSAATKAWAAVQAILNIVLSANPIGIVIVAIGALVAGLIYAYQNSETFRNIVNGAFRAVADTAVAVFGGIRDFLTSVWDGIKIVTETAVSFIVAVVTTYFTIVRTVVETVLGGVQAVVSTVWNGIQTVITTVVSFVVAYVTTYFTVIRTIIETVLNGVRVVVGAVWNGIQAVITNVVGFIVTYITTYFNIIRTVIETVLNGIRAVFGAVWGAIQGVVSAAISIVTGNVSGGMNQLRGIVSGALSAVQSVFSSAWSGIAGAVRSGIDTVVSIVSGLGGRISSAVGNLGSILVNAGESVIDGLVRGIRGAIGRISDVMSAVASKVKGFLPFSPAKEGPLAGRGNPEFSGRSIGRSLAKGIRSQQGAVSSAMNDLVGTVAAANLADVISSIPTQRAPVGVTRFGAGGVTNTTTSDASVNFNAPVQVLDDKVLADRIAERQKQRESLAVAVTTR